MKESNSEMVVVEAKTSVVRNIWWAGLGTYDVALEEMKQRLENANNNSERLISELVEGGRVVEQKAKQRLEQSRVQLRDSLSTVSSKVGGVGKFWQNKELLEGEADLNKRIEELSSKIDRLKLSSSSGAKIKADTTSKTSKAA